MARWVPWVWLACSLALGSVFFGGIASRADSPAGNETPTTGATFSPTVTATPTENWSDEFLTSVTKTVTPTPTKNWFDLSSTSNVATSTPTPNQSQTVSGTPTGTPSASTSPTPTKTPGIARSGLALFPTAYSNGYHRTDGFNLDILFSYFIGSIIEKDKGMPAQTLNPLRLWLFTIDTKYGWLDEDGDIPAIASGLMDTLLLQGGNPTSTGTSSGSLKFTSRALGGVYTVVSKKVADHTSLHLGVMRGDIGDIAGDSKLLKHFLPTGNFSDLMMQFGTGLSDVSYESAPNILYTGCDFKWLGTVWRFEVLKPFPLSRHPFMIDSKIDRLFAFNLAYEHWEGGYALLGYFNFRFTILPMAPKPPKPLFR